MGNGCQTIEGPVRSGSSYPIGQQSGHHRLQDFALGPQLPVSKQ